MNTDILKKYLDKALQLSIYSILFIVPLSFWLSANEAFETPKTSIFYSLIAISTVLFLARQALSGNFYFKWSSFSIPAAAVIAVAMLSLFKGLYLNANAGPMHWQYFKFILANGLLYFLIINVFSKNDIFKLLYFIFAAHFIVVAYGILQYFGVDFIKWVSFGEGRVYSTMGNPDYMAAQFSILIPLMIVLILSPITRLIKFVLALFLSMMFFLIIVSHGRGAWLGFLGSLVYMFIMFAVLYGKDFFAKQKVFTASIAAFVIFLVLIFSFPNPINKNSQSLVDRLKSGLSLTSNSASVRLFYWESAVQMGMHNPILGAGIGGFSLNTSFYQKKVYDRWLKAAPDMAAQVEPHVELYTHNDYLQTFAEQGFLGLGVFIWLLAALLSISIGRALKEPDTLTKNILLGVSGAAIAFMINALLNFPWRVATTLILLWSIFAILSLAEERKTITFTGRKFNGFAAILLIIVAAFVSGLQFSTLLSNSCIKTGQASFAAGRYDEARGFFERGLSSNPRGTDVIELVLYNGNAYNAEKNIDKAVEYYNKGLKMFPHFIESHYNVGNVYMNNNMLDKAIAEYNAVLALNPKFTAALNNLANIYFNQGDFPKSRDMYLEVLKYKPASLEARYNLGAAYFRMKEYKLAYKELTKTLEYDPNYTMAKDWVAKMKALGLDR